MIQNRQRQVFHVTSHAFRKLLFQICCYNMSTCLLFIILVLIETSHGVAAGRELSLRESDAPTHLNFFRAALRGRRRVLSCARDVNICLDREKNPWGGSTCCFQQFCRDTLRDSNNCGACGRTCAYGLVCCDGKCVDIQNDPHNCGSCFEECPGQNRCSFAMCDYGG
ncbi:hypothetical protein CRYUN_Cryun40dG0015000 [Craigia yunnanensis]